MRLTRLDLLAYGAFQDRGFSLRPDARLHVVYGANEAGKSTALSAMRDLLFGFPTRTTQDFRFKQQELRVGGELQSRDGARLAFVRRKGNRNTLLAPQGAALADDALAPFLGQMTREIFAGAFGLDAECLRKGAEDLLQARGEAGSSLMAAASGLRGLTTLRSQFDEEADKIFAPRASATRRFYQALERFDQAKKAIAESELRIGDWKKINQSVAQHAEEVASISDRLKALRVARGRLERLKTLAPLSRRIAQQEAALAAEPDAIDRPAAFVSALDQALTQMREAEAAAARGARDLAEAEEKLAAIHVDAHILDLAGEIDALAERVSEHQKDSAQLPRVAADRDAAQKALDDLALRIGHADAQSLVAARPADASLARVSELAEEGRAHADRIATTQESLRVERETLDALDATEKGSSSPVDPAPLLERLAAIGAIDALVATRDGAAQAHHREDDAIRRAALLLTPAVGDLDSLSEAALPASDAIAAYVERFQAAADAERDGARRAREAQDAIADTRRRLAALGVDGDAPTRERVDAARAHREAAWTPLRATLFGEPDALSGPALGAGVTRYEHAVAEADRMADAAARDAERVAAYAALTAKLDEQTQSESEIAARRAAQDETRRALDIDWTALWTRSGVAPLAPAQMQTWRESMRSLFERRAALADLRYARDRAQTDLDALAAPLASLAEDAGLSPMGLDPLRQSARIAARLRDIASLWQEAAMRTQQRADLETRVTKLEADLVRRETQRAAWSQLWAAALPGMGLAGDASLAEAKAAIDAWRLAPGLIEVRDGLARRVNGMARDIDAFVADLRALIDKAAPDLAALPPAAAVTQMRQRLDRARSDMARARELANQLDSCAEAARAAEAQLDGARTALASLTAQLPPGSDAAASLDRLKKRLAAHEQLAGLRDQWSEQAAGLDDAQIRTELAAFDPDRAAAELDDMSHEEERLAQASREAYAQLRAAQDRIAAQDQGQGSELAWQTRMSAQTDMQEAARRWLVLRLASSLLNDALERHRSSRQDPLLERASAIFAQVTGGGFARIAQTFDEEDRPVLQGLRATGERVGVDGMSEGTRDQLYLALRLAYVEDYATRAEPAPFIADDLFTSFDDARTAHGLRALAETGERTQCILFTHHRHVAELAHAELGERVDVVEL